MHLDRFDQSGVVGLTLPPRATLRMSPALGRIRPQQGLGLIGRASQASWSASTSMIGIPSWTVHASSLLGPGQP
jgi:hypothetical protein